MTPSPGGEAQDPVVAVPHVAPAVRVRRGEPQCTVRRDGYGTDYRLVHAVATTMKAVFPNVYLVDVPPFESLPLLSNVMKV